MCCASYDTAFTATNNFLRLGEKHKCYLYNTEFVGSTQP
jgi:hypothetical protein